MKLAQIAFVITLTNSLLFTPTTAFSNTTATPVIKGAAICPTFPDCIPTPNEQKPPKEDA